MIVQSNPTANVEKYCRLADVTNTYPEPAYTGIGVYRATKKVGLERGKVFDVRLMERHMYTSQAFIPMAKGDVSIFVPSGGVS
jgi:allantoicase